MFHISDLELFFFFQDLLQGVGGGQRERIQVDCTEHGTWCRTQSHDPEQKPWVGHLTNCDTQALLELAGFKYHPQLMKIHSGKRSPSVKVKPLVEFTQLFGIRKHLLKTFKVCLPRKWIAEIYPKDKYL